MEPAAPLAWLEFNGSPGTVPVYNPRIAIGRERDNDVVTDADELTVSRHHVVISQSADGSFHIANRSADYRADPNPVLINGVQRESAKIADGDVIKLGTGNYGFLFRLAAKGGH
jgi:pSer/pThr/pTyr-binding forkhead associated (FHA) protein